MASNISTMDAGRNKVGAVFDKILNGTGLFSIGIMVLLSIFVFGLTLSRAVFKVNIPGLFDGSVYMLVVFPLLVAAYGLKENRHISVDVLTAKLQGKAKYLMNIVTYLVSSIFVAVLGWKETVWLMDTLRNNVNTEGVFMVPKSLLLGLIVFGCLLLLIQIYRVVVNNIKSFAAEPATDSLSYWRPSVIFLIGLAAGILAFIYLSPGVGITIISLVLLFSGLPVFLGLGLVGVIGVFLARGESSLIQLPLTAYKALYSFPLTCLPLFVLGGLIMEGSGIAKDIFRFFEIWTGRFATSSLIVTILAGLIFCAISGSSSATTAVITGVALPILISRGFDKGFSCGLIAGATVGTIIPPSLGYVVYCVLTGESIGQLFMAGLLPGLLLFAFYFIYVLIMARFSRRTLYEGGRIPEKVAPEKITWKIRLSSLKMGFWGLLAPVLILGGIYLGVYTPTEAAAALVVYAVIVSVAVKRIRWQKIIKDTQRSALISAMVLCIIVSAYMFALVISQIRIAPALVAWIEASNMSTLVLLIVIFVILNILGLFLDAAAVKVITLPILYPVAMAAGVNGLWFGVFYQFCNEIGMLTPPVGMNLFVMKSMSDIPMARIIKGCLPFVGIMTLVVVIMYIFPGLATWLPSLMTGK